MIVTRTDAVVGTERDVQGVGFHSLRVLLAKDGLGFSLHETRIERGGPYHWHYTNHLEACYCVSGKGIIRWGNRQQCVLPGTVYALDQNDAHSFEALTDVVLVSVFNPPVTGAEIHQEDGSYERV